MRSILLYILAILLLVCVFCGHALFAAAQHVQEDVMFKLDPSAERALKIGEKHLDAKRSHEYDFVRAEKFLNIAYSKDHNLPLINLNMARVAFLKGNFPAAMRHINAQIELSGEKQSNAYYIRGLIEGYAGDYDAAIADYAHFLEISPPNWAAINDYAWVLLKANNPLQAASATGLALNSFPHNAWLLNTNATALYEIGEIEQALVKARAAVVESQKLGPNDWLLAYPGNDPRIAQSGIAAFKEATLSNMHTIELAVATSTVL